MKKLLLLLILLCPLMGQAQGNKSSIHQCSPMKDGKICYVDAVDMDGMSQEKIFKGISKWANHNYGKDIFLSNVVTNKKNHTIMVYSKVKLLLNEEETDKTLVTYRLEIACKEGSYTCRLTDITYQYNPNSHRNFINFPAEDVIANGGRDNKVAIIKDPKLFCNATFFFAENLFGDVFNSLDERSEW